MIWGGEGDQGKYPGATNYLSDREKKEGTKTILVIRGTTNLVIRGVTNYPSD